MPRCTPPATSSFLLCALCCLCSPTEYALACVSLTHPFNLISIRVCVFLHTHAHTHIHTHAAPSAASSGARCWGNTTLSHPHQLQQQQQQQVGLLLSPDTPSPAIDGNSPFREQAAGDLAGDFISLTCGFGLWAWSCVRCGVQYMQSLFRKTCSSVMYGLCVV